jgi:hypothetical protein
MNQTVIVLNSFSSMNDTLYESQFTHNFSLNLGGCTNVSIKVHDFTISDIVTSSTLMPDVWKPNQIYNLTADLGQISKNTDALGHTYLASKFYKTTYSLPSCYTAPLIKLTGVPDGNVTFSVMDYLNEPVRKSAVKNIGSISIVATLYYDNV